MSLEKIFLPREPARDKEAMDRLFSDNLNYWGDTPARFNDGPRLSDRFQQQLLGSSQAVSPP